MKERPILMSGLNVIAILEGRKFQTRRMVKPQPVLVESICDDEECEDTTSSFVDAGILRRPSVYGSHPVPSPYGVPGDRLWVRETFYCDHCEYQGALTGLPALTGDDLTTYMYYAADDLVQNQIPECEGIPKLKPSIFMPRWASRITLEIVAVRVERLKDISDKDAKAEGCCGVTKTEFGIPNYRAVWESINGPGSWDKNPWVWVIDFFKLAKNDL